MHTPPPETLVTPVGEPGGNHPTHAVVSVTEGAFLFSQFDMTVILPDMKSLEILRFLIPLSAYIIINL